jgi:hypothetical protein
LWNEKAIIDIYYCGKIKIFRVGDKKTSTKYTQLTIFILLNLFNTYSTNKPIDKHNKKMKIQLNIIFELIINS